MSQLTINLDDNLLQAAQEYARRHGQELDKLVAELLQAAVQSPAPPATEAPALPTRPLSPVIQKLYGSVKLPDNFDYKAAIEEALLEKYSRL
jgi:plasmid stability protein